jgi:putative flippase GtrA
VHRRAVALILDNVAVDTSTPSGTVAQAARVGPVAVLTSRAARYLVVGAGCTALDIALFNVGAFELGIGVGWAKVMSTAVAVLVSFLLNRQWTFGDANSRYGVGPQLVAYFGVNAVSALGSVLCMNLALALGFGSQAWLNLAAYGAVLTIGTAARYTVYRRWLFA